MMGHSVDLKIHSVGSSVRDRMEQLNQKMWKDHQERCAQLEKCYTNVKREILEEACKISISNEAIIQLVATVQHSASKVGDGSRVATAIKLEEENKDATLEMERFVDGIKEDSDNSIMWTVSGEEISRSMISSSLMYQDWDYQAQDNRTMMIVSGGDGRRAMISGSLKCQDGCCGGWMDRSKEVVCPLSMKMFRWVFDGGGETVILALTDDR